MKLSLGNLENTVGKGNKSFAEGGIYAQRGLSVKWVKTIIPTTVLLLELFYSDSDVS